MELSRMNTQDAISNLSGPKHEPETFAKIYRYLETHNIDMGEFVDLVYKAKDAITVLKNKQAKHSDPNQPRAELPMCPTCSIPMRITAGDETGYSLRCLKCGTEKFYTYKDLVK